MSLLWIFFFLFGLIVGSFLNVVILRYNTGQKIGGRSRSMCLSCHVPLQSRSLIPLISYVVQRARCLSCKSKISVQYPLVEIVTGILFMLIYFKFDELLVTQPTLFVITVLLHMVIWSSLIIIFVYDLYHTIIPNLFVYIFAAAALLLATFDTQFIFSQAYIVTLATGPLFLLPFFLLWDVSGGKWIGLGDGKLALGIGWLLGFVYGISALVLAFWIGALFSVFYLLYHRVILKKKRKDIETAIPFAPFMILGCLIVYLVPIDVLQLSLFI